MVSWTEKRTNETAERWITDRFSEGNHKTETVKV